MGEVYRARDPRLNRTAAMKTSRERSTMLVPISSTDVFNYNVAGGAEPG